MKGKRNGKGKEYNEFGNLIFEGEYLNGERNGKGKEYNEFDELIFEGEYLKGKKHGKGKSYGNHEFEGEYFNGKRWNGKGSESGFSGEYYKGLRWNGNGNTYKYTTFEMYDEIDVTVNEYYSCGELVKEKYRRYI